MQKEIYFIGLSVFIILLQFSAYRHYAQFKNTRTSNVIFAFTTLGYIVISLSYIYGGQISFKKSLIFLLFLLVIIIVYSVLLKKYKNQ